MEEEMEEKATKQSGPDFKIIRELMDTKQINGHQLYIEDVIASMLEGVSELSEDKLTTYLPEFIKDVITQKVNPVGLSRGVDRYMKLISDQSADYPRLPGIFFNAVMRPLLEKKLL